LEEVFRGFHKSCIQRKILRADREGLECEEGSSDEILREFYRLMVLTRRRHGLPPQPFAWFRNLRDCFGAGFRIRIATKNRQPLASILTLQFKNRLVYKYGCSDARFHHLGTMPWLFWRTVQDGKELGLTELDLGRSDQADQGLIAFKDHLGACSSTLTNYRHPRRGGIGIFNVMHLPRFYAHLPTSILKAMGSLLYRHVG
jgi:lipid II:glycine glycyltransferase (peptidoglycan interpeptide bridge formation enzyme)